VKQKPREERILFSRTSADYSSTVKVKYVAPCSKKKKILFHIYVIRSQGTCQWFNAYYSIRLVMQTTGALIEHFYSLSLCRGTVARMGTLLSAYGHLATTLIICCCGDINREIFHQWLLEPALLFAVYSAQ
jgi:hypothetical protein